MSICEDSWTSGGGNASPYEQNISHDTQYGRASAYIQKELWRGVPGTVCI